MRGYCADEHAVALVPAFRFPGVVPRTFLGALSVAALASPYIFIGRLLGVPKVCVATPARGFGSVPRRGAALRGSYWLSTKGGGYSLLTIERHATPPVGLWPVHGAFLHGAGGGGCQPRVPDASGAQVWLRCGAGLPRPHHVPGQPSIFFFCFCLLLFDIFCSSVSLSKAVLAGEGVVSGC